MERKITLIDEVPVHLDLATLLKRNRLKADSEPAQEFQMFLSEAQQIAHPKAVFIETFVTSRGSETVTIDGQTFTSRVLRTHLAKIERVFPFVATCGEELDRMKWPAGDILKQFWLEDIKAFALECIIEKLIAHVKACFSLDKTASMNPGSGDGELWPIEQQRLLFDLFKGKHSQIGVVLTDNYLMIPTKSVSGIIFPTAIAFHTCQLCRREVCSERKVTFDEQLWRSFELEMF